MVQKCNYRFPAEKANPFDRYVAGSAAALPSMWLDACNS
jgi:hypothetical protein